MSPRVNSHGYAEIKLGGRKGKVRLIHRLVAETFISNCDPVNKKYVHHADHDKGNNHTDNLIWVDIFTHNHLCVKVKMEGGDQLVFSFTRP